MHEFVSFHKTYRLPFVHYLLAKNTRE